MNRTITIIYLFSVPQINDSKIVWEVVRILVKAKPESKHIIKALLKAAVVRAVPVKQEKIKSPDFLGEYGVTSVTPFLFASISLAG